MLANFDIIHTFISTNGVDITLPVVVMVTINPEKDTSLEKHVVTLIYMTFTDH
jgi:hypothetical protein